MLYYYDNFRRHTHARYTRFGTLLAVSAATVFVVLCAALPAGAQSVYVGTQGWEFGTIDLQTGSYSPVGATDQEIVAMGFTPSGDLFGFGNTDSGVNLLHIDKGTGSYTNLGIVGPWSRGGGMDPGGKLYGFDIFGHTLYSVEPQTQEMNTISVDYGRRGAGMIAFQDAHHMFASIATEGWETDELFEVDSDTGARTRIGSIGFTQIHAGLFVNGVLYAFGDELTENPGEDELVHTILRIDTTTGAGTEIGRYNLPFNDRVSSVAFLQGPSGPAAVPEPGILGLLLALLPLAFELQRRLAWASAR